MKLFGHEITIKKIGATSVGTIITTSGVIVGTLAAAAGNFALNELDKGIAAAKEPLRDVLLSAIGGAEAAGGSATEKLAAAVKEAGPKVVEYLLTKGFNAVEADVEQFTKGLIESTLADFKVTKSVTIARAFLSILHIK